MERKYIVPASTMISGLILWIIFLIVSPAGEAAFLTELLLGLISGGLILFSAFRCRAVGGPKEGNIFRASLLFIMTVLSFWLIGNISAIILLMASAGTFILVSRKPGLSETA
jgi:hypothetical protein